MNNQILIELMGEHQLTVPQVAELLGVSRWTVRNWVRPPHTSSYRKMPDIALKALEMSISREQEPEPKKPTSEVDLPDLVFSPAQVTR